MRRTTFINDQKRRLYIGVIEMFRALCLDSLIFLKNDQKMLSYYTKLLQDYNPNITQKMVIKYLDSLIYQLSFNDLWESVYAKDVGWWH